jgi:hypothetical protein
MTEGLLFMGVFGSKLTLHKIVLNILIKYFPKLFERYYREYSQVMIDDIAKRAVKNGQKIYDDWYNGKS